MPLPTLLLAAASLLVFFGALVQSAVGFGLAVLAAPLLYLIDPILVPAPVLVLAAVLSLLNVWKNRAGLAVNELSIALIGRIPGMIAALWLLRQAPGQALPLLIGLAVLAAIGVSLTRLHVTPTPRRLLAAGLVSGFMGTSTSIGGPPMALLYQHSAGIRIRANLSGYFLVSCIMSLFGLALIGHFGRAELTLSLWLLPPALAGFVAGRYALRGLRAGFMRPALLMLCTIAALGLLADALFR